MSCLIVALLSVGSGCRQQSQPVTHSTPTFRTRQTPSGTPKPSREDNHAFADASKSAGLRYRWSISGKRPLNILQTIGNGCAFFDFDCDGNLDILLVGRTLALYRGNGSGHFTDVSVRAGLSTVTGHFLGCAVGDYDNDGFADVYITAFRGGVLLHNYQGIHFEDATRKSGISAQPWSTSATFADTDRDGRLDLFICNYVLFGSAVQPQLCNYHGVLSSCGPVNYAPDYGVLYRNQGSGHFRDVTAQWCRGNMSGKGMGVAAAPTAGATEVTLAIANDQLPGDLLCFSANRCRNLAAEAGTAYTPEGQVYGGMGIDWGDYDNDGKSDIVIGTYQNQAKLVFKGNGSSFTAQSAKQLDMMSSVPFVSFGVKWIDFDNDGRLDILLANGHVQDNVAEVSFMGSAEGAIYRQRTMLYRNVDGLRFIDDSARLHTAAHRPIVGRGLATGDYDNDGRVDALVVDSEGEPVLLHNETPGTGHWLGIRLEGRRCNRDAYGATVTARVGLITLMQHCHADGSYLSSSDKRVHFGLAGARMIDELKIAWPDGVVSSYSNVEADRFISIREGTAAVRVER